MLLLPLLPVSLARNRAAEILGKPQSLLFLCSRGRSSLTEPMELLFGHRKADIAQEGWNETQNEIDIRYIYTYIEVSRWTQYERQREEQ